MRVIVVRLARVEYTVNEMDSTISHYSIGKGHRYTMGNHLCEVCGFLVRKMGFVLKLNDVHVKRVVCQQRWEGQIQGVDNLRVVVWELRVRIMGIVGITESLILGTAMVRHEGTAHLYPFDGFMTMEVLCSSVIIKVYRFDILKAALSVEVSGSCRDRLGCIMCPV